MASKTSHPSVALFLSLNLVLFALVSGTNDTGNCGGHQTCSIDTLKLGVCANLLNLVNAIVGSISTNFTILQFDPGTDGPRGRGLLVHCHKSKCSGIINLNATIPINLILSACGRTLPTDFTC
ncbi:hypothetical protein MTR67_013542 [Solanum verrucosum]|uniref:Hydrophobic seed protein domain-containing protein n=1 Tax=Solanum verrucosum TaxID=315347 RepID=A0AAF0QAP6_SOLVR|nr:hypothetical protein MTR67_013542 [Solanum verrucosum]